MGNRLGTLPLGRFLVALLAVTLPDHGAAEGPAFMVRDINTTSDVDSSSPQWLTAVGGTVYFSALHRAQLIRRDRELWTSDGSAEGTFLVRNLNLAESSFPTNLAAVNGQIFFVATDTDGKGVWKSDGSEQGTTLLMRYQPGAVFSSRFASSEDTVFFGVCEGSFNRVECGLWRSDGTTAGTTLITALTGGSVPEDLVAVEGVVYFEKFGVELWRSDGSDVGTFMVKDIRPGRSRFVPSGMMQFNGALFFAADDGTHGLELWRSDGSSDGTAIVSDILPGIGSGLRSPSFFAFGESIYFEASDGQVGFELWRSDGTSQGTRLVRDIWPGTKGSEPGSFASVGSLLLFQAVHPDSGRELWKTDGSSQGTALVRNVWEGPAGSNPEGLTRGSVVILVENGERRHPPAV
jgi:ELWxxDGT repeat protein